MSPEEIQAKFDALCLEEALNPNTMTYWLSFASETENLGCAAVVADGPMQAIRLTKALGINPGGEVAVFAAYDTIREEDMNRLLTRDYVENEMRPKGQ